MVGLGMRGRSTLRDVYGAPPPEYDLHRGRSHMPEYRAPPAYDMHSMRGHSTIDDIENAEYARELMLRMQHSTLHDDQRGMPPARHGRHNSMYDMGPHREVMTRAASYVNEKVIEEEDEDNLETVALNAIVMARKAVSAEKLAKDASAQKRAAENALASAVKEDEKQREAEKKREDEKNKSSKAEADAVAFVIATARKLQNQGDNSEEEEVVYEEDDERQDKIRNNHSQIPLTRKDTRQADLPQVPLTRKDTRQADRNNPGVRISSSPPVRINPNPEQPRGRGRSSKPHRSQTPERNKKKGGFFNLFGGGSSKQQTAPNGSDKKGVKVSTARGKTPVKETKRGSSKSVKRSQSMTAPRNNNSSLTSQDDHGSQKHPGRLPKKSSSTNLDDIAVITNWEHQPDGSITGNISNSPNYEDGMVITTAPVTGRIVVTESGHKYRLT